MCTAYLRTLSDCWILMVQNTHTQAMFAERKTTALDGSSVLMSTATPESARVFAVEQPFKMS